MVEGRRREAWDHTALLAAVMHNVHCLRRDQCRRIEDFHPWRRPEPLKISVAELARLVGV